MEGDAADRRYLYQLNSWALSCSVLTTMVCLRAWGLGALSFGFFLIVNPLLLVSCGENDQFDRFEYDEQDMLAVVEELNQAEPLAAADAQGVERYQLRWFLEQRAGSESAQLAPGSSWISSAHACTQRSFVKEAGACISSSELLLQGTLFVEQEGTVIETLEVEGTMFVLSRLLDRASFTFQFGGGTASLEWDEGAEQPFSVATVQSDAGGELPGWGDTSEEQ